MITSRRDYLLRIIDEVGQLLARALLKRNEKKPYESLQSVVMSCERLFNLEAAQLFQFTPAQHYIMLTEGEPPADARDKALLYAAINMEAGKTYQDLGKADLAQASFANALRFTLKARAQFTNLKEPLPAYAPAVADILALVDQAPLDPETAQLLADYQAQ